MKILVIDDSNSARYVLMKTLRELGYKEAIAVESAEDGLERLKTERIDLILLDWNLNGMSGLEFLRQIRSDSKTKSLPVIMVTTVNERNHVMQALKLNIQGYFFKPVTKEMMESKLREIETRILTASRSVPSNGAE
jgi:two-component system, chemotaxis family, chemotaxis protein CheY